VDEPAARSVDVRRVGRRLARHNGAPAGPYSCRLRRRALRTHVLPAFGELPIARIEQVDVRRLIADLIAGGAAPGTVRGARKVARLVFASAAGSGAIKVNPCDGVRVPRSDHHEMMFLSTSQIEALAEAINPPYGVLIRLAAYTGLRAGEIGALRVGRLDLLRRRIEVVESLAEEPWVGLVFGPPRT
jgi:integrase